MKTGSIHMGLILACSVLMLWSEADARGNYRFLIPSHLQCATCHVNARGGGARNAFGRSFAAANNSWTANLCNQDSDGDGFTNGAELGDPDCMWRRGAAQREAVSNPADANDQPMAPVPDAAMDPPLPEDMGVIPDAAVEPPPEDMGVNADAAVEPPPPADMGAGGEGGAGAEGGAGGAGGAGAEGGAGGAGAEGGAGGAGAEGGAGGAGGDQADAGPASDADGGTSPSDSTSSDDGGCSAAGDTSNADGLLLLLGVFLVGFWRRRRSR